MARERAETVKESGFDGGVSDPKALLTSGLDFLSGLSVALSKPETTRQLVDSIVSQDPADGKTYLKIPVESRQVVENVFGLIGSVMKGLGK